jgi:hypothetical protein
MLHLLVAPAAPPAAPPGGARGRRAPGTAPVRPTVAYRDPVGKGMVCAVRHGATGRRRAGGSLAVVVLLAPLLVSCAGGDGGDDAANRLLFSPDAASAAPSGSPRASGQASRAFPESCSDLVPTPTVVEVVGVPLPGQTTFVYADEQPDIQRLQRVTCGYGVPEADPAAAPDAPAPEPAVEITLNEYEDADAAADRVEVTLDAAAAEGSQIATTSVGDLEATVLRSATRSTLVVQQDALTAVVTMRRGLVPDAAEPLVLTELAARALGVETSATPSATPTVTPPATPLAN